MKNILVFILIGFLLGGCQSLFLTNQNVFDNHVCQSPCWMNITPGITTKEEALTILSKISFVDQPSVDMHRSVIGFDDEIQFSVYSDRTAGWIYLSADRVSMIGFENNLSLTMQSATNLFGTPENMLVIRTSLFDGVTLLNAKKGVEFDYRLSEFQSLDTSNIQPNTKIYGVTFFDPNHYQQVLNSGILSSYALNSSDTTKNLKPWNGYGSFKDKYWPPATPSQ